MSPDNPFPIPRDLLAAARREQREPWLDRLPALVHESARRWGLSVDAPYAPGGQTAWVAPARSRSWGDVVLKVMWPHAEAAHEADALRVWDGDGAVRVYAAEALASIGPSAASATSVLAGALSDPIPGVRWAACEALASIGPAAQSAVPQLIDALEDEFLYVRIFAAGALGSIGPKAQSAREALRAAADDPALRDEAEWALSRIAGITPGAPVASHF